jgi:hypothetical protein
VEASSLSRKKLSSLRYPLGGARTELRVAKPAKLASEAAKPKLQGQNRANEGGN